MNAGIFACHNEIFRRHPSQIQIVVHRVKINVLGAGNVIQRPHVLRLIDIVVGLLQCGNFYAHNFFDDLFDGVLIGNEFIVRFADMLHHLRQKFGFKINITLKAQFLTEPHNRGGTGKGFTAPYIKD